VRPGPLAIGETTTSRIGSDIMKARDDLRAGLIKSIAAAGGALLEEAPLSAIRSIVWRAENGSEDELDYLDNVA